MTTKLDALDPRAAAAATRALAKLWAAHEQVVVTSTLRTQAEQWAYWCQGRKPLAETNSARAAAGLAPIVEYIGKDKKVHSDNEYTITNCDGTQYKSPHQSGLALDVVPDLDPSEKAVPGWPAPSDPRWVRIAEAFKAEGFEWGGDWKDFPDYPHYQYRET